MGELNIESCRTPGPELVARLIHKKDVQSIRFETEKRYTECVESLKTFPHSKGMKNNAEYYRKILEMIGDYEEILMIDLEEA